MTTLRENLEKTIAQHPVVVFTKGNKIFPRCGFSAAVIAVFQDVGLPFECVDIFEDPDIKPTLVSISDWPTTPQIFIGGEFVGGGDLVRELHARGELKPMVEAASSQGE
ncbi:MAG: glutaredoxin [Planctomycetes bacterium]|nr:glutaredoxin [Planctomycetota bacterium]